MEFAELISLDEPAVYDITYTESDGNKQMSLEYRPQKEITCYDEWIHAWDVYQVIYLKHPANAAKHQQMVTYVKHIHTFREQGYNQLNYNHTFRHQRLTFRTKVPLWGCIRQDLFNNMLTER